MVNDAPIRIVIADDSHVWQMYIPDLLEDAPGVRIVAQVTDATSAVDVALREHADIVLLDVFMPGNGVEAMRVLKQQPNPPVVIMITGLPHPDLRELCLAGGADYFFDKAKDLSALYALICALAKRGHNATA